MIEVKDYREYPFPVFEEDRTIYFKFNEIWKEQENEEDFVKYFVDSIPHEVLHIVIGEVTEEFDEDWTDLAEEKVVRSMNEEEFPEEIQEWYR